MAKWAEAKSGEVIFAPDLSDSIIRFIKAIASGRTTATYNKTVAESLLKQLKVEK